MGVKGFCNRFWVGVLAKLGGNLDFGAWLGL